MIWIPAERRSNSWNRVEPYRPMCQLLQQLKRVSIKTARRAKNDVSGTKLKQHTILSDLLNLEPSHIHRFMGVFHSFPHSRRGREGKQFFIANAKNTISVEEMQKRYPQGNRYLFDALMPYGNGFIYCNNVLGITKLIMNGEWVDSPADYMEKRMERMKQELEAMRLHLSAESKQT